MRGWRPPVHLSRLPSKNLSLHQSRRHGSSDQSGDREDESIKVNGDNDLSGSLNHEFASVYSFS